MLKWLTDECFLANCSKACVDLYVEVVPLDTVMRCLAGRMVMSFASMKDFDVEVLNDHAVEREYVVVTCQCDTSFAINV